MSGPRVLWEAHVRRFEDAFHRYRQRILTAEEAGELLGMSARHFRRHGGRSERHKDHKTGENAFHACPPARFLLRLGKV